MVKLLALLLTLVPLSAWADTLTFAINIQGPVASAVGTITFSNSGPYRQFGVSAYSLTLSANGQSDVISQGLPTVFGNDLFLSGGVLAYNFGDHSPFNEFILDDFNVNGYLYFSGNPLYTGGPSGVDIGVNGVSYEGPNYNTYAIIGTQIATPVAATPEPASVWLLATGILGLAAFGGSRPFGERKACIR